MPTLIPLPMIPLPMLLPIPTPAMGYSPPVNLASHQRAGRIELRRLGVRHAADGPADADTILETRTIAHIDHHEIGPVVFRLNAAVADSGDSARIDWRLSNHSDAPLRVDAALIGARWTGRPSGSVRFLRHGWQSWSFSGYRSLDMDGEPAFPGPGWIRGMHHAVGERPADRAGWHESATVTVASVGPGGPGCLVGALERGRHFALAYLRPAGHGTPAGTGVELEMEVRLEVVLAPGETRELESLWFALGDDDAELLERFATHWGRAAEARTAAPWATGWCSWYHYFHRVSEADVLRNLDALVAAGEEIPTQVVQLDDGFQRAVGDWLETNERFPRGLAPLAADIRAAGFRAGLWTAPFCVVPESRVFAEHAAWLLTHRGKPFPALFHGEWSARGWVHALDPTRPEVIDHLREIFAALVEMGWDYLKLDFLFTVAMRADASDANVTRAERLYRALSAVRAGAGEDAFLLGCGCPLGPAVGVVDAMRVGPDVAPHWEVRDAHAPGLGPVMPSTDNAIRGVVHRSWMHRRLWLNDPDCLMARSRDTDLAPSEARALAAVVAATGGLVVFSDDVSALSADDRARIREVADLARRVDDAWSSSGTRALGSSDADGAVQTPEALVSGLDGGALLTLLNLGEAPVARALDSYLDVPGVELAPCLGTGRAIHAHDDRRTVTLGARDAAVYVVPEPKPDDA